MALNFPSTPANGQIYYDTTSGNRYVYDSTKSQWRYSANSILSAASNGQVLFEANNGIYGNPGLTFSPVANTLYTQNVNARFLNGDGSALYNLNLVSANNYANSTFVKLTAPTQTITGDIAITGNLSITGNTTTISAAHLQITDSLIMLAANNYTSDIIDIGFTGTYNNGTANLHTGIYRDHLSKEYFIFNNYAAALNVATDIVPYANGAVNAILNADLRTSNLILGTVNAITWIASAYGVANAAYGNANAISVGANVYAQSVGLAGNNYASIFIANTAAGGNAWANTVGVAGNNYTNYVGSSGNAYTNYSTLSVNTYASILAANNAVGANNWANTVATAGNNYTNSVGVAGNNYASILSANNAVGANAWSNTVGASANSYAQQVGVAGNNYASILAANNAVGANAWANTVGTAGNNYTNAVGVAGNNYTNAVGVAGNNYTNSVGAAGNSYINAVGAAGNNYTNSVGVAGNNYTNYVGASGNSYAQQVGAAANSFTNATYVKLSSPSSQLITSDIGISGNLTISGTTTFANTQQLQIGDNILTLNADLPLSVTPTENAGLEVNRGNRNANASLYWIEAASQWSISENNAQTISTYIASNTLVETYASSINSYVIQVATAGNNYANTLASNGYVSATFATLSNVAIVYNTTNAAFSVANSAFAAANNITPQVAPSYNTANAAFNTANSAYAAANNITPQVAPSYNTANNAYNTANAAFAKANVGGANIAATPPVSPSLGQLWWDTNTGRLFIYYNDGTSTQWVESTPTPEIDTGYYVLTNLAFATANAAYGAANNITPQVAPSYNTANAAYNKANAALANTSGVYFNGNLTFSGSATANNGLVSLYDYRGPFGDGVVVDYDYSNSKGRVSVGANDSLTFYTGGVGTIPIMTIAQYGFVGIGTTNPIYPVSIIANGATTTTLAGAIFDAEGSENATVQLNIRNARNGTSSSGDVVVTADDGNDSSNFIDLGINSSNYATPGWTINGARDGYLYSSNTNLAIGTANTTAYKSLSFFVGGTLAGNEVLRIQDGVAGGNIGVGRTDPQYKIDVVGSINAANILINGVPLGTASVKIQNTAPTLPAGGNMWWDSDTGKLYIYYIDVDTAQWVEAAPPAPGIDLSFLIPTNIVANLAFDTANAAFASANNVAPQVTPAFNTANAAFARANAGGANVGQTAPVGPTVGRLWWNTDLGKMFIYYTDPANTSTWVETSPSASAIEGAIVTGYINPVFDKANNAYAAANASRVYVANSAPGAPTSGSLWWNKDFGRLLVYYTDSDSSQWVDTSPSYDASPIYNTANSAFDKANSVITASMAYAVALGM